MQLPDVDVLIYAHREDSPDHLNHAEWLKGLAGADEPFAVSELILSAFVRIVTNRRIFDPPTPLAEALRFSEELISLPNCVIVRPGPRHWRIFSRLCGEVEAMGPLVADAYLASLALENGCEFVTCDSDFARFPGLRWRHPLEAGDL